MLTIETCPTAGARAIYGLNGLIKASLEGGKAGG
jgi:hypothetical protein